MDTEENITTKDIAAEHLKGQGKCYLGKVKKYM